MAGSATQFVEALCALNTNVESLAATFASLTQALASRPKPPKQRKAKDTDEEKTPAELEAEYWQSSDATRDVARVVGGGEFSSVNILHDMQEVQKKIEDVAKAQELGIISIRDATKATAELGTEYADLAKVAAGKELGGQAGAQIVSAIQKAPKAGATFALDQLTGIATGALGLLQATAIGGGLFGLLLHGVKEADRLQAEAGEITNIFSAAGATASRGAIGHFAAFQEHAQTFYGVARQEVQTVLKEFMLAGVSVEEILAGGRKGMGEVGHDAVTLSIAMDKMFELSGGFTASQAMQMVRNQGAGVGEAVDRILKIEMLAHRAGAGVEDFTGEAVSAANELAEYGIRADSVAVAMTSLQDRFKDIGLNAQTAMEYAQQGVREVSSGLKGANLGIQASMAEQLGLGSDMSARYELLDSLHRGKERDFIEIVQSLHRVAKKETKGTYGGSAEVREREYLERQGFGVLGSKAVYTMGEQVAAGQKIDEASKQEWEEIKKAFKVEGTKVSDLQKQSARLTKALAKMGQGILFTITNFMALMLVSVKTMLSIDWKIEVVAGLVKSTIGDSAARIVRGLGQALNMSDSSMADPTQILAVMNEHWKATEKSAKQAYSGMSESLSALRDIVGPLMKPIFTVLGFDEEDVAVGEPGKAGLTPAFWREFDAMCGRLGVEPGELKKVITAETGFDPERSNYIRTADGGFKLDAKGRKIAQAKGLGSWLHSTAIRVAGMTEEQWQNLEKMPAMAQLPFLERTFRAMGVRGLTAEQIHVRQFGTGFMKTNPTLPGGGRSIYIGKAWWESEAGKKWLKEHPEYKSQALRQYNMYEQNKQVDQDGKGYITEEDVAKTTVRCKRCNKVLYHCKCPKVKVVSVTKEETTSGTNYKVRLEVDQWGRKPKRRSTTQKAPSAGVRCDPNVTSCVDPSNPDKPLGVSQ